MNLMNSKASNYLSKAKGSYFLAAQFAGMLRCSLYGDVSQITVFKLDLSEISVRNQNGSRILEFPNKCHYYDIMFDEIQLMCGVFACSKNFSQLGAIEMTIYSGNLGNITVIVEGAVLYQCRHSTYEQEINEQIRILMSTLNDVKQCGWFSKDVLPWTTTLLTSVLSLFLTVIYVIKFCSWGKFKENPSRAISSSNQGCSKIHRNVTDNNYETPHHYTEIQV
nr:uncharacterized protein LOC105318405 [Crassostrea gigas]